MTFLPETSYALTTNQQRLGDGSQETFVTMMRWREGKPGGGKGALLSEDRSLTLATANDQTMFVSDVVRRLTPTECERLQGFPDGWTDNLADGARYRCLGNAVCVDVAEWIGRRLMVVA